ncbi:hypothetical protein [Kitasatospora sp. NPDC051164]|uniref:hypothetical protein n=1 Tax=Kitasatospora sp. NPDC051164 TaxID=3364055 RepID=UPI0037AF0CBA
MSQSSGTVGGYDPLFQVPDLALQGRHPGTRGLELGSRSIEPLAKAHRVFRQVR